MDVPVNAAHVLGQILPALDQLIGYEADSGRTNPFTGMHATIDPDTGIACIAIWDPATIGISLYAPKLFMCVCYSTYLSILSGRFSTE